MKDELHHGDLVVFHRGLAEVRGTVAELYGTKDRRRVVVALTPEISGDVVDEPTTVALSVDDVRKVVAA